MSESFDEILIGNQAEGVVIGARIAELRAIRVSRMDGV